MSASHRKIQLQETVEAGEIDEEKWTKLKGRSIVPGERLFGEAILCRFYEGDVNMEHVPSRSGLGFTGLAPISMSFLGSSTGLGHLY